MRAKTKAQTTIIKRSARKAHDAVHGGAWKVAFADFTLAMMALFMVLWIMSSVSEKERKEVVYLLNGHSIFDGMTMFSVTSNSGTESQTMPIHAVSGQSPGKPELKISPILPTAFAQNSVSQQRKKAAEQEIESLARVIMQITSAYEAQSNLQIEIVPQGLRILIQDDQKRDMFQRGSAILMPFFQRLLAAFAQPLNSIDNKIIITGHTDATRYRVQEGYSNWNLSGERAMQAHNVLTKGGLDESRILQVSGMADKMLLIPDDPTASANRRIEIMVLTGSASDALYQFFGRQGEKVLKPLADKIGS